MTEQRAQQEHQQMVAARQAQEDEMLRMALEESRRLHLASTQKFHHSEDLTYSSHHSEEFPLQVNNSQPTPAAASAATSASTAFGRDCGISSEEEAVMTEEEIAQIRQALEQSEREMCFNTHRPHLATSGDEINHHAIPRATKVTRTASTKDDDDDDDDDDQKPTAIALPATAASSRTNSTFEDPSVNWKAAADYLSPEELAQIQQALATAEIANNNNTVDAPSEGLITEAERAAVAQAIAEADAAQDQASYQLALELARQEHAPVASVQRASQPQGHIRVVSRAQVMAELRQRHSNVGAFHATGPVDTIHPADTQGLATAAGFRMNAASPQTWNRRGRAMDTVIGPDSQIRTKHDATLHGQSNAHRLALDTETTLVGNKAFNAFHQSMKRNRVKGVAAHGTGRAGSDADGVKGGAMDGRVREHITRAINQGWLSKLNGAVKEGKEALVYHGKQGEESGGFDVAVKVFKRIVEFRQRGAYVDGDPRYVTTPFSKVGPRQQLEIWCEKEFRNLVRANRSGVPVATPLHYKENILFMRFLGENGWPSPQLREIDLRKGSSRWTTFYTQVMQSMKILYQEAHLVHADLSEYNILAVPAYLVENKLVVEDQDIQAVMIDFGQSVDTRHPDADRLLLRDLDRVNSFFKRQGVVTMTPEEAYHFCVVPEKASEDS